jgi:hypothetical protein
MVRIVLTFIFAPRKKSCEPLALSCKHGLAASAKLEAIKTENHVKKNYRIIR